MKKSVKVLIASIALLAVCGFTNAKQNYIGLHAEGEETSEPVVIEEEQPAEEEKENFVKKSYEEFVVPLLSGVSISSVVAFVWIIVSNTLERKSREKKSREEEERRDAQEKRINERYEQVETMLSESQQTLAMMEEMRNAILGSETNSKETKEFVLRKMAEFEKMISKVSNDTGKIESVTKAMQICGQLEIKLAKQSQNIVKSGIVEDINELAKLLKEI